MTKQKTHNVTNLTPDQRRQLFIENMTQPNFCAFIKNQNKKQTHYTFQYKN
jgi:hypothetical protein